MSDEPLDLRSLADLDEPEMVGAALRTFRRRVLTRYLWVTIGVALLVGAVVWGLQPNTLEERIGAASPAYQPQATWLAGSTAVGLARVVSLGDDVGVHLVGVPTTPSGSVCLKIDGSLEEQTTGDGFDVYVRLPRTTDGRYEVRNCSDVRGGVFTLDMSSLGVPADVWKESA